MTTGLTDLQPRGWWLPEGDAPAPGSTSLRAALLDVCRPFGLARGAQGLQVVQGGRTVWSAFAPSPEALPVDGFVPALHPRQLGDASFVRQLGLRYAYIAGAMANGIASADMVEAMAHAGMLGIFGAAGLPPHEVEANLVRLARNLGTLPYGSNLIHSPSEPALEDTIVDLYLKHQVRVVCASAYLTLTLPVVRYRFHGIHRDAQGRIVTPNHVLAKVSRVEVARKFFAPPPATMLATLVGQGHLTQEQAEMAACLPVAQDITAEADSGGHTDNRPALALLPTLLALRDEMQATFGDSLSLRVGAAGGIGTPAAAAACFAMGAAYLMVGSVHQACLESGTSDAVRAMLAQSTQADVTMAPAADMFEMGVKVQVLKWGTMFPVRARKLYDLYRDHASLEALPAGERALLERDYFRCTLEQEWSNTRAFFELRDPSQIVRAEQDPKHRMALVFRSYLGRSSGWANAGDPTRKVDYQIWCGPAMGAFNEWVKGSYLEAVHERRVTPVALNFLLGAAVLTRASWLRAQGVILPAEALQFQPLRPEDLEGILEEQGRAMEVAAS